MSDIASTAEAPVTDLLPSEEVEWSLPQLKMIVLICAAVFIIISAALVGNQQLYYMAALLLVLPIVSYAVGVFSHRGIVVSRRLPASAWEGETVDFELMVEAGGGYPRLFLRARDDLPRWLTMDEKAPPIFHVAPSAETSVAYRVRLEKRGRYDLSSISILATDPLGLFTFARKFTAPGELLVYPRIDSVPDTLVAGSERYGFRDLPQHGVRGAGVDPDGVRGYVPGDPLRRMHWKSVARTGKLHVVEFEESRSANLIVVLDIAKGAYSDEGSDSSFERLVRVAAGLSQSGIRQGSAVRLVSLTEPNLADSPGRGSEHLYSVLAALARVEPNDPVAFGDSVIGRVGPVQPGTTVLLLTAHIDSELSNSISHLLADGSHVMLLYADPTEFGGRRTFTTEQQRLFDDVCSSGAQVLMVRKSDILPISEERGHDGY
jgi:uncharacterized protein (DUF58 family)